MLFLSFVQLRNMWRQKKQSFFSAQNCAFWLGFFSLKSLHPYNGCLSAHCGEGGYPNSFGLALNAKIRLIVFVFTDFSVFDWPGKNFIRLCVSALSFNHSSSCNFNEVLLNLPDRVLTIAERATLFLPECKAVRFSGVGAHDGLSLPEFLSMDPKKTMYIRYEYGNYAISLSFPSNQYFKVRQLDVIRDNWLRISRTSKLTYPFIPFQPITIKLEKFPIG